MLRLRHGLSDLRLNRRYRLYRLLRHIIVRLRIGIIRRRGARCGMHGVLRRYRRSRLRRSDGGLRRRCGRSGRDGSRGNRVGFLFGFGLRYLLGFGSGGYGFFLYSFFR